ncbi:MAG: GntR family transcriptional regulator [Nitrospinae bacterium]|nr:GntR family transcriptional regulator [Nitrospinota bacterium]
MRELFAEKPFSNEFIPYYYQIANLLRGKIESGELIEGMKLPKELDLSKHFGVSRVTLRQALAILEKEGLVTRERRKGTFVNHGGLKSKMIQLTGAVWEEDAVGGDIRVISIEEMDASSRLQEFFGSDDGESLTRVQRLRMAEETPLCYVMNYLPQKLAKDIPHEDIRTRSMLHILKNRLQIRLGKIHQTLEARVADSDVADHLSIGVLAPVLYVETFVHSKSGEPVEFSQIYYRGDQHRYRVELVSE